MINHSGVSKLSDGGGLQACDSIVWDWLRSMDRTSEERRGNQTLLTTF